MDAREQQQYGLDFTSRFNEVMAQINSLGRLELSVRESAAEPGRSAEPVEGGELICLSAGRVAGVIDLLKRLVCLSKDLTVDPIVVEANVPYLAGQMRGFRAVNEKTVRNWQRDGRLLGLISMDHAPHKFGFRARNSYSISRAQLTRLLSSASAGTSHHSASAEGGNGRQWAATIAAPRAATIAAPRAATIAALPIPSESGSMPPPPWLAAVSEILTDPKSRASASAEAIQHGLTTADVLGLVRYYTSNASAFRSAGVLSYVLRHATPGCAADPGRHFPSLPPQAAAKVAATRIDERRRKAELDQLEKMKCESALARERFLARQREGVLT